MASKLENDTFFITYEEIYIVISMVKKTNKKKHIKYFKKKKFIVHYHYFIRFVNIKNHFILFKKKIDLVNNENRKINFVQLYISKEFWPQHIYLYKMIYLNKLWIRF